MSLHCLLSNAFYSQNAPTTCSGLCPLPLPPPGHFKAHMKESSVISSNAAGAKVSIKVQTELAPAETIIPSSIT